MNKTISVNLSGMLFNIEEVGYDRLAAYLNKIKSYFAGSSGSEEIIQDIESRIAELFHERLSGGRQVITEKDVSEVMDVMGKPEDFAAELEEEEHQSSTAYQNYFQTDKKLFRDADDHVLGGVCSGIAHYFGIDRVWFRLLFIVAFIFAGSGLLLYIILWIVIPEARTTADKLRMKGEPVNVGNIEKRIKEDLRKVGKAIEDVAKETEAKFRSAKPGDRFNHFAGNAVSGIGSVIRVFFNILGKFLGFFLLLLGLALFIAIITFSFGSGAFMSDGASSVIPFKALTDSVFETAWQSNMFYYGLLLLLISPIIALLLAGLRLLMFPGMRMRIPASINGTFFILGLIFTFTALMFFFSDFNSKGKVIEPIALQPIVSDTVFVNIETDQKINLHKQFSLGRYNFFFNEDDQFVYGKVKLNVFQSAGDQVQIKVEKAARGGNKEEALNNTEKINFAWLQDDNNLTFNPHFTLMPETKWRAQQLSYDLLIPKGKYVLFHYKTKGFLNDLEMGDDTNRWSAAGQLFKMEDDGLHCLNCEEKVE